MKGMESLLLGKALKAEFRATVGHSSGLRLRDRFLFPLAGATVHRHVRDDPGTTILVGTARKLQPPGVPIHEHEIVAAGVRRWLVPVEVRVFSRILRVLNARHDIPPETLWGVIVGVAIKQSVGGVDDLRKSDTVEDDSTGVEADEAVPFPSAARVTEAAGVVA